MGVMNWVSVSRCWSDDGRHLVVPVTHLNSAKITFVRSEPGLGWKRSLPMLDQSFSGIWFAGFVSRSGARTISCHSSEAVISSSTEWWSPPVSTTVCGSVQ